MKFETKTFKKETSLGKTSVFPMKDVGFFFDPVIMSTAHIHTNTREVTKICRVLNVMP